MDLKGDEDGGKRDDGRRFAARELSALARRAQVQLARAFLPSGGSSSC